jgi:hypothetical protein
MADLSPLANGGVIANTAVATGGVPSGGDELVGLNADGSVDWNVPYQDQDVISPGPISDASGNVYYVRYPGDRSPAQLVAARGTTVRWSKPLDSGADQRLAVGTNGQVYELDGNNLHGRDASDGHDLFPPLALSEFASGSYDRLFAYDQGLVIYSGYGKILYVDYAGKVTGGPYTYSVDPASTFERDIAASATGDLFIAWYDQALTSEGCLDTDHDTHLAKYSPAGLAWSETLPHVSRCNTSGPHVAATPNGGAVVSGSSDVNGATVQYADASGVAIWRRDITTVRGVLRPHVDQNGEIFITTGFAFDCHLWSDICTGVQVSRFGSDGAESKPIFLKGDPEVNQESWASWSGGNLTLTPGNVVLALRHNAGGASFPTDTPRYSVDSFSVSGVGAEYPQSALWEMMRGSTTPTPTPDPSPTPTSPSPTPPSSEIMTYVAMGDSYSAGEGLGPYVKGTDVIGLDGTYTNKCHRSLDAYGPLLSIRANKELPHFVACSGAITHDYFNRNSEGNYMPDGSRVPSQQGALSTATTSVTLTFGGNDVGFADVLETCTYDHLPQPYTNGQPGCSKISSLVSATDKAIEALDGKGGWVTPNSKPIHPLTSVISDILDKAPNATLYVADYPIFFGNPSKFPLTGSLPHSLRRECNVGEVDYTGPITKLPHEDKIYIDSADAKWLNDEATKLNSVIRRAVAKVNNPRVKFVAASSSFKNHGFCDSKTSWIQSVRGVITGTDPIDVEIYPSSFHPTRVGQDSGYRAAFKSAGMAP